MAPSISLRNSITILKQWGLTMNTQKKKHQQRMAILNHSIARQGSSMTQQWKSGTGNCAFSRIAKGTAYPAMAMLKLPVCKTAGRIERECDVAPKVLGGEAECIVEA